MDNLGQLKSWVAAAACVKARRLLPSVEVTGRGGFACWPLLLLLILACNLAAPSVVCAQYNPVAWWQFDQGSPGLDATGNGHHFLPPFVNFLNVQSGAPVVGEYLQLDTNALVPYISNYIDGTTVFDELTMEFWFRRDMGFFWGDVLSWGSKANFRIWEDGIAFRVWLQGAAQPLELAVPLDGAATGDGHRLLDGGWHHVAGTFDVKTGTQRIHLDGECAAGFTRHWGTTGPLRLSTSFTPSTMNYGSRALVDLDEIAIYDTVLPPALLWQHWHEGITQGSSYSPVLTMVPPPHPPYVQEQGMDPLEYAPGYPNVATQTPDMLANYPAPRYPPGHTMPRLLPWMGDAYNVASTGQAPFATGGARLQDMLARLATDYNYYLYFGGAAGYHHLDMAQDSAREGFWMARMAQNTALDSLPRMAVLNWHQINCEKLSPALPAGPMVFRQTFADSFYMRNAGGVPGSIFNLKRWNWHAAVSPSSHRRDTLQYDGLTARSFLRSMDTAMAPRFWLDMIGENGEALINFDSLRVDGDPEMQVDRAGSGLTVQQYEATRSLQFNRIYSDPYMDWQDSVNNTLPWVDSVQHYWYNMGGNRGYSHFRYEIAGDIHRFGDGLRRGTPYVYPQVPARWRYGVSDMPGFNELVPGRRYEVLSGDRHFMPSVSPGYNDGSHQLQDRDAIRPGQFLGMLKAMAMMGADGYALYMYDGTSNPQYRTLGNWRAWQPVIPAYAQAIANRLGGVSTQGHVLEGDLGNLYTNVGPAPSYFTFSTGNQADLIVARRHDSAKRYALHGSIMRISNFPSHAPRQKVAEFRLADSLGVVLDTVSMPIRAQGSTYILDLSAPGDTVFYQLDGWHEWKEPSHWCRDFALEGELRDSASAGSSIHTERRNPHAPGDFTDFTSWLQLPAIGDSGSWHFATRGPDQDSLRVWIMARCSSGGTVDVHLDGAFVKKMPVPVNGWVWQGLGLAGDPVMLRGLGTTQHVLRLTANNPGMEIDKVLLARDTASFVGQAFAPVALALYPVTADTAVVCLDDTAHFDTGGALPAGCVDYEWDFGDGTRSFERSPTHLYVYADTYQVVLSVHHACLDSTAWDTLAVVVSSPHVDAGRDTFLCAGDSIVLQGEASYFFKWREDSLVSSPIVQHPLAWPGSSGYIHLDAWDPLSGCPARDSVHVTVVGLRTSTTDTTIRVCTNFLNNYVPTTIGVSGGYHVWWAPDPHLGSTTVRNPVVSGPALIGGLHLTAYLSDVCRCDTDTVVVHVLSNVGLGTSALAVPDTICEGDTVQLSVAGMTSPQWTAPLGGWLSGNSGWTPLGACVATGATAYVPQTQGFAVRGFGCNGQQRLDTAWVVVRPQSFLGIGNMPDTTWACPGGVISGLQVDSLRALPTGYAWSPAWAFLNPTALMSTVSPALVAPTAATLTLNNGLGCPHVYSTVLMPYGLVPDSVYQCPGDHITVGVSAAMQPGMATNVNWSPPSLFANSNAAVTTVSVPVDTTIHVTYFTPQCGTVQDSMRVIVHGLPRIAADTLRACQGDTVQLVATNASPMQWGIDGGWVGDSTANVTWAVFGTQAFTLYVASCDSFFCPGFDSVVVAGLDVIAGSDSLDICLGDTVAVPGLVATSPYTCAWTPLTDVLSTAGCTLVAVPLADRHYWLDWVDSAGCAARDSVWINIDSVSITAALISVDDTICIGDSLQLLATGGATYLWTPATGLSDDSIPNPLAGPTVTTTYTVAISNGGACVIQDSVRITVDSLPPGTLAANPDTICAGQLVTLTASGGTGYSWAGPGVNGLTTASVTVALANTATFTVTVTDGGVCAWVDSVTVEVDQIPPLASITTPDTLVCAGSSVAFSCVPVPGAAYLWQPGGATTANMNLAPVATGYVNLTVDDGGGCLGYDSVFVEVRSCCTVPGVVRYVRPRTANLPFSTVPANGGAVHIVDTLFVNSPSVNYINKTFYMDSAAVIHVLPNCTLNVVGCTFVSACGNLWEGISLPGVASRLVMLNGVLRDAIHGVWSRNGGSFAIDGALLRNNYVGMQVEDFNGPAFPGSIRGTRFLQGALVQQPLPQPYSLYPNGYAGIRVRNVQNITIGFPDLNPATENLFVGMVYGIEAWRSRVEVYHNRFQNIVPPTLPVGVGVYCGVSSTGQMAFPANWAVTVGHPTTLNAQQLARHANTFTNCYTGVFALEAQEVRVRGNSISGSGQFAYGVFVKSLRANVMRVERNTVASCQVGVWAGGSTQVDGTVSNNSVTNTGNGPGIGGVRLDNMLWGNLLPGNYPMQVRDNNIDVHGNGVYLNANHGVNVEGNTVRVRRVTVQENLYGIFAGSNTRVRIANNPDIYSSGTGVTNVRTAGVYVSRSRENLVLCNRVRDVARSVVFVGDCKPTDFLGNRMQNGVDGFVMLDSAKIGEQGRNVQNFPVYIPAQASSNVWQGTFTNSWTNANNSVGDSSKFFVRSVPNQNPLPGVNHPVNNNFAKMHPQPLGNGNLPQVNCNSMMPGNGSGDPAGQIRAIAQVQSQGNAWAEAARFRAREWAYTALLKEPALMQADSVIQAYYTATAGTSVGAASTSNEELIVPDTVLATVTAAQITPLSPSEANHKAVLDIRLDDPDLDSVEVQQLLLIANQCEELGGRAVNIARGLLAGEGILIWDDPGCAGAKFEGQGAGDEEQGQVVAECWPNPTGGRISLRFSVPDVAGTLSVFDGQGRLLLTEFFNYQGLPLEVDASAWSQGLLLVRVDLMDGSHFKWRVVVQR
ncbi:MAG: LamG-like jellyroll fold domain-containing protein [Bacteroidia bacterium]